LTFNVTRYTIRVIRSFADRETARLFRDERVKRFLSIERPARKRLALLDAANDLRDVATPGNKLEALRGKWAGAYSIRINDRWRIRFIWREGAADDVEVVDYH
jgi:proteic killer suppression protein